MRRFRGKAVNQKGPQHGLTSVRTQYLHCEARPQFLTLEFSHILSDKMVCQGLLAPLSFSCCFTAFRLYRKPVAQL